MLQRSTYTQLGWCSYVRAYVRACVRRTSRWKILFTPYLVVELSSSAEIWCAYVTSVNDGTQILTFLGINNNRDFQNSRPFCGNLVVLKPDLHWFLFSDRFQSLHSLPELCTHSYVKRNISVGYSQRYLCLGYLALDENVCFTAFKKYDPGAKCGITYYIMYFKFAPMQKYGFLIFWISVVQCKKMPTHVIN